MAAVIAVFLASSATSAATISAGVDEYGNHYLTLDGPIVAGDPERLAAAIFDANARGYRLDALRLNSHGGAVWEAMAMAVMVRWVENMATVVQKDARCESACFGLFAAGYRKFVDPADNQIGVHSIYQLIKQEGAQTFLQIEKGDTTVQMVRLLDQLGIPDSVIAKIVTTPPDEMSYLTIRDLWKMGVKVAGHPRPPSSDPWNFDFLKKKRATFLSPAVLRTGVTFNGTAIPAGTVVVARDDVTDLDKYPHTKGVPFNLCFVTSHLCTVSYRLADRPVALAQLQDATLELIRQGWQRCRASFLKTPPGTTNIPELTRMNHLPAPRITRPNPTPAPHH